MKSLDKLYAAIVAVLKAADRCAQNGGTLRETIDTLKSALAKGDQ